MTGRATSRTRVGLATTALAASFLAGMAVASATGPATVADPVADPVRLANAALRPATSCEELRQWYVDRALGRVTAWGWDSPVVYYADDVGGVASQASSAAATPAGTCGSAGAAERSLKSLSASSADDGGGSATATSTAASGGA